MQAIQAFAAEALEDRTCNPEAVAARLDAETQRLVVAHMGLVKATAWKVAASVGGRVEVDELEAAGYLGLVSAAVRWRSDGGASFSTFVYFRVEGAMLSLLRKRRWFDAAKFLGGELADVAADALDRTADDSRHARGSTPAKCGEIWLRNVTSRCVTMAVLREVHAASQSVRPDEAADGTTEPLEQRELRRRLDRAIAELNDEERLIILRIWKGGDSLSRVAELLGVSKSYVGRLHLRALDKLRVAVDTQDREARLFAFTRGERQSG